MSSLGLSALVIWDLTRNKSDSSSTEDIQKQLQDQLDQQKKEGKLQGTKLTGFTPVAKVEKLQIIDLQKGTGDEAKAGGDVTAHYTGAIAADGTIFQSSHDSGQPVPFNLSGVIKGWTDGVPGMKVGGKRRLLIPASEAYGANPPQGSNIPPNADLVFDIELTAVN